MHIVFDESNSLDSKMDICSIDDDICELMETNGKPLELEGPSKGDSKEMPKSTSKDDLPKDW